jgi:hypothetical protein
MACGAAGGAAGRGSGARGKAKGARGRKNQAAGGEDAQGEETQPPPKKTKSAVDSALTDLRKVVAKYQAVQATATSLQAAINSKDEWSWARSDTMMGNLNDAMKSMSLEANATVFQEILLGAVNAELKHKYVTSDSSEANFAAEVVTVREKVSAATSELDKAIRQLQQMHGIRMKGSKK